MSKSIAQGLIDIYVAPKSLFDTLQDKKGWSIVPFLLLLITSAVVMYIFFAGMSPSWIVEQQMLAVAHTLTPAEIENTRAVMGQMADKSKYFALGGIVIGLPIMLAIQAAYIMLVGNSGHKRPYGSWFAMSVWVSMPSLINMLGLLVLIMLSSTPDMPINSANYLSLNQLVFNFSPQDTWFSLTENFNLTYLWSIGLAAVGLKSWSGYSTSKAVLLAALPLIVIFGIWALFI
ncbi:YIP1 family protein [Rheinheimera metallidurans]|uniref:YIP1 family protein n=1 Tax=Rheinheimera metallidurans TaxID=2925781 RepID=UPI003001CC9F